GLAEPDVTEAYVVQRPQLRLDRGHILEHLERLVDGHLQDVRDRVTAKLHLEHLAVVPRAVTNLARHVDIGQELHLDLDDAVALAVLTAPALDVEAEAARLVATHLRLGHARVQVADMREHAGVRRGVAARSPADRRLVDVDRLVQVLEAFDGPVRSWTLLGMVEVLRDLPAEDVGHQRRLPRAADP